MLRLCLFAAIIMALVACHHPTPDRQAGEPADTGSADHNVTFSPGITADDIVQHVRVLSSDAFEGRGPGSEGGQRTVDYLIREFRRIGLQPGNHGHWRQPVPFVRSMLVHADQTKLAIAGSKASSELAFGNDMVAGSPADVAHAVITDSPIVFVGYGVHAPAQQWDDYAGIDLKGKTVVMLVNDPGWRGEDPMLFKGRELTWYGHWAYKFDEAARQGAAAAFIVHDTDAAGYPWSVVQTGWSGPQFNLPASENPVPRLPVAGWLTTAAARKMFADAGIDFDELARHADIHGFKPIELQAKASITVDSTITQGQSDNVIAELPGTRHAEEALVYSAHWDHLGKQGGRIYHGAVENASGVAGLLEIAEAFAHSKPKPHRSTLFLALTLEESGLLGSQYYATHPAIPLNETVADIDMDALTVIGPSHDIAVIGSGESQLDDDLAAAARQQGRTVTPENAPKTGPARGFLTRADQFNFARFGVPVLYARSGMDLLNGGVPAGRKAYDDYIAHRYHQPTDVMEPNWDLRGMVQDLRLLYVVGSKLSGETRFPQWNPTSDFRRPDTIRPTAR